MRWMRWTLLLVVLVGVLGMHGLSNAHEHGAQVPTAEGTGYAADRAVTSVSAAAHGVATQGAPIHGVATHDAQAHDASAFPVPASQTVSTATKPGTPELTGTPERSETSASSASMTGHLMAMCLAILLGAVLFGVLRLRRIDIGRVAIHRRIRTLPALVGVVRPRPPTLHQLCVLRI